MKRIRIILPILLVFIGINGFAQHNTDDIDAGMIEPIMIDGECWGIHIAEYPDGSLIGYALKVDNVELSYTVCPPGIQENTYFQMPYPAGTELCWVYHLDVGIAEACCTVPVTTTIEKSPVPEITLFPQPATTNINLTSTIPIMEFDILNLTGEKVNTFNLDGAKDWNTNINHLDAGIYIVRYVFENKDETFRKMIVR